MTVLNESVLDAIVLNNGRHATVDGSMSFMEAVARLAGVRWGPEASGKRRPHRSGDVGWVSPVLGGMGRALGEELPDQTRQRLVPLIPALLGTGNDALDHARGGMAADWLVRTWTPAWLDLLAFPTEADQLRALPPVTDRPHVQTAEQVLTAIADPFVRRPGYAGDAAAPADPDDGADADPVRWQVTRAVITAMVTDSCRVTAWNTVYDALAPHGHLFIDTLFYVMRLPHLRPLAQGAALTVVTAGSEPRDPDEAYHRATQWLRPTVDRLQNSAVDLLAAMTHPPPPFVLAYQPDRGPEPRWVVRALNRFGRVKNRR